MLISSILQRRGSVLSSIFGGVLGASIFVSMPSLAKTVVLWQPGFPTVDSQPIEKSDLDQAFAGEPLVYATVDELRVPSTLANTDLLVLPYGSAFPSEDWTAIRRYLQHGGNFLILGGVPFQVPVAGRQGNFHAGRATREYTRAVGILNAYPVPVSSRAAFHWKDGYGFLHPADIKAQRFFTLEDRALDGLGYMVDPDETKVASPVVVSDRVRPSGSGTGNLGSRTVMLDFDPVQGYWRSADGISLLRTAAEYARQGAVRFWTEVLFSAIQPDDTPHVYVHLRDSAASTAQAGWVSVKIASDGKLPTTLKLPCNGPACDLEIPISRTLPRGFYTVTSTYEYGQQARESYVNGFWVEDKSLLDSGPRLGSKGNFLTRNGEPYFPFGTNYFSTENNGWDFSGSRNAWVWEKDFSDMERHNVTFVRTGVWMNNAKFIESSTGGVSERFARNLEAYLLSARNHHIAVNFTFFAFSPRSGAAFPANTTNGVQRNPYLNPVAVHREIQYVVSVVNRFKNVPWLSWDLINEPSFSNPAMIFHGNVPNGDPTETAAWRAWLQKKYRTLTALGSAWSVPPEHWASFEDVPLPSLKDITYARYGNEKEIRAIDYNLFAQDMFTQWVKTMVLAIRSTGSKQLIDVGQDEGGVTDRLLNQFFVQGGVSFTANHTYWQDDALLWDSVVSRIPGVPNIVGETGYQPVWNVDGTWRYDELTGADILERKWALGLAAGTSGTMQWDWAREPDFGMQRSDGSAKLWESKISAIGAFVKSAEPWATGLIEPQVALILPQSLQLSAWNSIALEAQQNAVRALYYYARAEAYPVGEYQIDRLGKPKLIILPSAYTLTDRAWSAILERVKNGSTLLISGPFDADAHFHSTNRGDAIGLAYTDVPLLLRHDEVEWPEGKLHLSYSGNKTTILYRANLTGGGLWAERSFGQGKILFSALPLEFNDDLQAVGKVYSYALQTANVSNTYTTTLKNPGILICPTEFPSATLYVLTSESNLTQISFRDSRSGRTFTGRLSPGGAALLLVKTTGEILAAYNWQ